MAKKRTGFKGSEVIGPPEGTPWWWYVPDLITSPAWRGMGKNSRDLIDFLELENAAHAGTANGNLVAPYNQLEKFGLTRRLINDAIEDVQRRRLVAVERGFRLWLGKLKPNRFRLTFRATLVRPDVGEPYWVEPGNEWKTFSETFSDENDKGSEGALSKCTKGHSLDENENKKPRISTNGMKTSPPPLRTQLYISRGGGAFSGNAQATRPDQQRGKLDRASVVSLREVTADWLASAPRGAHRRLACGINVSPAHLTNFLAGRRPLGPEAFDRLQRWLEIQRKAEAGK